MLAHGFAQTGSCWGPLAGWLRAEGHDVATPNLAGHGAKPMPAAGLPGTARALGEQGGPAVYVGYSFGGRVALRLAMDRPDLVAGLVLIGATAGLEDPAERAARVASDELLARSIEETGVAEFLDR